MIAFRAAQEVGRNLALCWQNSQVFPCLLKVLPSRRVQLVAVSRHASALDFCEQLPLRIGQLRRRRSEVLANRLPELVGPEHTNTCSTQGLFRFVWGNEWDRRKCSATDRVLYTGGSTPSTRLGDLLARAAFD